MPNKEIRGLKERLETLRTSAGNNSLAEDIVDTLNDLSYAYYSIDPEMAEEYAREACEIAKENEYLKGLGWSYRSLGISYGVRGDYYRALERFNKCVEIYKSIDYTKGLAGVSINIGIIYTNIGDYTRALEQYLKCVELCEDGGYEEALASTYINIGVLYNRMDNLDKALESYLKGMKIYETTGNKRSTGKSYANIGNIYRRKGKLEIALEYARKSLKIKEEINDTYGKAHAYDLLGLICLEKGEIEESLEFFSKTIEFAEEIEDRHRLIGAYLGMGEGYSKLKKFDRALDYYERGINLANEIELKDMEMEGYSKLAEFYEKIGEYKKSLSNYKKYINLKNEIIGEKTSEKVAQLEVKKEIENKEREAEIHRLKNEELVKEIEERKRVEKALQKSEERFRRLSIEDPLTGVFNRRYFFERAGRIIERLQRDDGELSAVILDIDHFKNISDRFGHLAGDNLLRELALLIGESIRPEDILARYGGEEFVLLFSKSSIEETFEVMERVRKNIEEKEFRYEGKIIRITVSAGIAGLSEIEGRDIPLDELLKLADERLYIAKKRGRNRVVGRE
jgi:diguanylate cyclase (GGDEF)-like protein